jgi:hypothetical protein
MQAGIGHSKGQSAVAAGVETVVTLGRLARRLAPRAGTVASAARREMTAEWIARLEPKEVL